MIPGDRDKTFKSSVKQSSCHKNCFVCGKDFENINKFYIYYTDQKCLFGGISIMELFSFVLDQRVLSDCDVLRVCGVCSTLVSEASFALHQFTTIKNKIFLLFNANKQPKLLSHLLPDNIYFESLWPKSPVKECSKLSLEDLAVSRQRKKKVKDNKLKKSLKALPHDIVEKSSTSQLNLIDIVTSSENDKKVVELSQKGNEMVGATDGKIVHDEQRKGGMLSVDDSSVNRCEKNIVMPLIDVKNIMEQAQQSKKETSIVQNRILEGSQFKEKAKMSPKDNTMVTNLAVKGKEMPQMECETVIKHPSRRAGRPRKPFQCQHCYLKFYCNEVLESHCRKYHKSELNSDKSTTIVSSQETSSVFLKESISFPEPKESKQSWLEKTNECKSTITIEAGSDDGDEVCRVITFPDFDQKLNSIQSQNELEILRNTTDVKVEDSDSNENECFQTLDDSTSLMPERKPSECIRVPKVEGASKCTDSSVDCKITKSSQINKTSNNIRRIEPRPRAVKKIEEDGSIVYILSSIGGGKVKPSLIKLSPEYVKYMSENKEMIPNYGTKDSPVIQKFGKLKGKDKMNSKRLKLLRSLADGYCHDDQCKCAMLHPTTFMRGRKTNASKWSTQLKTSSSSNAALQSHNYYKKKPRKFGVVSIETKKKKKSSEASDKQPGNNTTTGTVKATEEPIDATSNGVAASITISLARLCEVCGLSFASDVSLRKHCADHLLGQAPSSVVDSLDIVPPSNLPISATHLNSETSLIQYPESSTMLPESLSASPFPAVPIPCSSPPGIKSPSLDEAIPRDSSLSVLLPVLPEGLPIAPMMTTPTDLRHLLAAELEDRSCDWRSKNLQNLPENPLSMDLEIGTGRLSSVGHELSSPVINDTNLQEESVDFDRPDDSVSLDAASGMKHAMMDVPFTPPSQNSEAIRDSEPFSHSLYHEEFSSPYSFKLVPDLEPTHGYCMGEAVAAVASPLRADLCSEAGDGAGDDCTLSASDRMSKKLQRVSSHL